MKNILVDEKQNPYTGTNYAWVRARVLGGKTNIWGRLALRLSDYDFKAKTHDGFGEDWPISYADIEPYYDRVDQLPRHLRPQGKSAASARQPLPAPAQDERAPRSCCAMRSSRWAASLTPYRAGVTTDGVKHNKYRSKCYGRGACGRRAGRLRHPRRLRFADGTDLSRDGHRQPHAPHQLHRVRDHRRHEHGQGQRRRLRRQPDAQGATRRRRRSCVVAASTLESARLLLLSKSSQHPNGIGNSSSHVGHNFCEHLMGPGVTGLVKDLVGKPRTARRRPPGRLLHPALPQPRDKQPDFIRGYGFEGGGGKSPGRPFIVTLFLGGSHFRGIPAVLGLDFRPH